MKRFLFIPLLLIIWACNPSEKELEGQVMVPDIIVSATNVLTEKNGPLLLINGVVFSGYLSEYNANEKFTRITGYVDGLKEGKSESFYKDGALKETRFYLNNHKEGNHQGWWPSGIKKYDISFENGLTEGESLEWYQDGTPYKAFVYLNGQEIGSQKMWEVDGGIRANYVVKNGHRYGLVGLKNCKSVENNEGSLTALAY